MLLNAFNKRYNTLREMELDLLKPVKNEEKYGNKIEEGEEEGQEIEEVAEIMKKFDEMDKNLKEKKKKKKKLNV